MQSACLFPTRLRSPCKRRPEIRSRAPIAPREHSSEKGEVCGQPAVQACIQSHVHTSAASWTRSSLTAGKAPSAFSANAMTLVILPLTASTSLEACASPRVELALKDASAAVVNSRLQRPCRGQLSPARHARAELLSGVGSFRRIGSAQAHTKLAGVQGQAQLRNAHIRSGVTGSGFEVLRRDWRGVSLLRRGACQNCAAHNMCMQILEEDARGMGTLRS
jgi:hypothetical protein